MSTLYKHQQHLLDLNPKRHLLAWGTGTGKTITSIELAHKNGGRALFIVPKALNTQWCIALKGSRHSFYLVVTKEEFRRDWQTLPKFDCVVVDEAHYFFGMKSQMAGALEKYCKKHSVEYRYFLTATPYLSTAWNIYMAAVQLGYAISYPTFKYRFFYDITMGRRVVPKQKDGIEDELAKIVHQIGSTVRLEDCVDVPEQVYETETFELTSTQKRAIENLTDTMPIVRFTKQHQIENGHIKGNEYEDSRTFDSHKTDRIAHLVHENKKIAIVCRYNGQISFLKDHLAGATDKKIFVINGEVKDRAQVVKDAEAAEECVVLIQASCSEGYELPSIGVCVFASLSFSFKDYRQMQGRFLRINALKKNVYIHLVAGEIDMAVYSSIMKKQDFDIAIYSQGT